MLSNKRKITWIWNYRAWTGINSSSGLQWWSITNHPSFAFEVHVIGRTPQWNYGSVIHSCHYLFYTLWLPEFHLHKVCSHTLITPGPLCTCINHHFFSSKVECAIHPDGETTKSNCISNFLVCQISPVQK